VKKKNIFLIRDKKPLLGLSAFSAAFSYYENQFPPLIYFDLFTAHLKGFFVIPA